MADESDNGSFELKLSGALDSIDEADELGDSADILTTKYGRPTEIMTFLDAVKTCFKKWSAWEGRASRSESNWFYLLQLLVILPLYISLKPIEDGGFIGTIGLVYAVSCFGSLIIFMPALMVNIRRLHDLGYSGWVIPAVFVISLMPLIGILISLIYTLVLIIAPGDSGSNKYGPVPTNKYDSDATTLSVSEALEALMERHVIPDYEIESEKSKIVTWLIISSSCICALLIIFSGFFIAGFLGLFGFSEDVSWELMGTLVYIAVLAMTVGYISWDGDLSRTLQMFKIGSFRIGLILLIGLPFVITVIDIAATNIYDILYIMFFGTPSIPEIVYYVDDSEYDLILVLSFVSMVIAAPVVEEILFRGYILDAIRKIHGDTVAILGSAGLFGLIHLEPYVVGMASIGGVIYGWVRIKTGSLWPSIVSHMVWNFTAFLYIWYG
uniref:Putative metal-dependent membrane protease n=1 Tax=uncultured marine group II/III euryarchaeote KM3_135_H05 TaxID=1457866 RepID=A0A075GA69_9EURY|nr:putative metal-dependent membrane protease [uncultured marine group II/III euryarchaeote KM3_135_H05]